MCKYNLIPYEVQPPSSLIGKFKNATKLTHEEYERNFTIRRELVRMMIINVCIVYGRRELQSRIVGRRS